MIFFFLIIQNSISIEACCHLAEWSRTKLAISFAFLSTRITKDSLCFCTIIPTIILIYIIKLLAISTLPNIFTQNVQTSVHFAYSKMSTNIDSFTNSSKSNNNFIYRK